MQEIPQPHPVPSGDSRNGVDMGVDDISSVPDLHEHTDGLAVGHLGSRSVLCIP